MIVRSQTSRTIPSITPEQWRTAFFDGLILLLVLVAYYPALHAGFIWDDDKYVTENPLLTEPDGLARIWFSKHSQSQYFPLVYSTFRLEYELWGLKPFGFHLVNVLFHAANALLLWTLLRRLAIPGAWLAAAIFAVHPVQVESVAWVTELKNTESTLFFLLALLAWIRFVRDDGSTRWRFYALSLVAYALALFSKTTACTLPAALVLVLWLEKKPINRARIFQITPFLIFGLAMGLVSIWWEGHLGNYAEDLHLSFTPLERLVISTRALWFYAWKLLWPSNLAFSYARWQINTSDPRQYVWLLGCLVAAAALWQGCKRWGRLPVVAVVFFVATLSPMLGLVTEYTFRFSFVADHYQYLASAGLIALFAGLAANAASRWQLTHTLRAASVALLLVVLGSLTWRQAGVYENHGTLWSDTLAKNPESWLAENNLGFYLAQNGRGDEAISHFESSVRLNPRYAKAFMNLGGEHARKGDFDEAIKDFRNALEIQPDLATADYDLGSALAVQGKVNEAIGYFRKAVQLNPKLTSAWVNLTVALNEAGKKEDALETLRQQLKFDPANLFALNNLAEGLAADGKFDEAIAIYRRALQVSPQNLALLNNLGNILFTHGHVEDGINCLKQAAQASPANAGIKFNLAVMLLQNGERAKAKEQLTEALRLRPDFAEAEQQLRALDAVAR